MHLRHVGVIALLVVAAGACGSSGSKSGAASKSTKGSTNTTSASAYNAPSSASTTAPAAVTAAVIKVSGDQIVTAKGFTVYAYKPDSATASQCNSGCDSLWPPVTTTGTPPAIPGVTVTTLTRSDGTKQVVVDGHPIYTFASDAKPGDEKGQGIGGVWHYVNDKGQPDEG